MPTSIRSLPLTPMECSPVSTKPPCGARAASGTCLHSKPAPEALEASIRMYVTLMHRPGTLSRPLREMLAVVTSQANDCDYGVRSDLYDLRAEVDDQQMADSALIMFINLTHSTRDPDPPDIDEARGSHARCRRRRRRRGLDCGLAERTCGRAETLAAAAGLHIARNVWLGMPAMRASDESRRV